MSRQPPKSSSVERIIPITIESEDEETPSSQKSEPKQSRSVKSSESIQSNAKSVPSSSGENASDTPKDKQLESLEKTNGNTSTNDLENQIEIPRRLLPAHNVPEHIVIVLDRAKDEISTSFELNNGKKLPPLQMLKHALTTFLSNKNSFESKHTFALMVLNETSTSWLHDFSNDIDSLTKTLNEVMECETEDIFNLNCVFDLLREKIELDTSDGDPDVPPKFVVRVVFIYGRSITMPELKMTEEIGSLLDSPFFTFDVLMTHEVPDSANKCQMIFERLQQIDMKGFAYFFSVSRNSHELHLAVAKLLAHPLQRPSQKIANYKLNVS